MTFKHKLVAQVAIAETWPCSPCWRCWSPALMRPRDPAPVSLVQRSGEGRSCEGHDRNQPEDSLRTETDRGKVVATTLTWKSSGGSITTDGVFSASYPGTYKVVGRGRGRQKGDTSTVVVVPPPGGIVGIQVAPGDVSVDVGASKTFSASALLADGTSSAVEVTWSATGGSIDAGGVYKAGSSSGKFKVIATGTSGDLADTAS